MIMRIIGVAPANPRTACRSSAPRRRPPRRSSRRGSRRRQPVGLSPIRSGLLRPSMGTKTRCSESRFGFEPDVADRRDRHEPDAARLIRRRRRRQAGSRDRASRRSTERGEITAARAGGVHHVVVLLIGVGRRKCKASRLIASSSTRTSVGRASSSDVRSGSTIGGRGWRIWRGVVRIDLRYAAGPALAAAAAHDATVLTPAPRSGPGRDGLDRLVLSRDQRARARVARRRRAAIMTIVHVRVRPRSPRGPAVRTSISPRSPWPGVSLCGLRLHPVAGSGASAAASAFGPSATAGAAALKSARLLICHSLVREQRSSVASSWPSLVNSGVPVA